MTKQPPVESNEPKSRVSANTAKTNSPMRLVMVWWGICIALFLIGWPILYARTNMLKILPLVALTALLATLAFNKFASQPSRPPLALTGISRMMLLGLAISTLLFFPTVQGYAGLQLSDINEAVGDQSAAYQQSTDMITKGSASRSVILMLNTLAAPLTLGTIPYFVMRAIETRLLRDRMLALLSVAPSVLLSLLTGRTQAMGVIVVVSVASLLVVIQRTGRRLTFKHWLWVGSLGISLFAFVAWRSQERKAGNFSCRAGQLNCTEETSGLWDALITVSSYAGQGFEGFGRALEGTWSFGGGFSHSPALRNFVMTFGAGESQSNPVTQQLYQHGWDEQAFWSSGWSQLANDVPWILIPFLLALVAALTGAAWRRAVREADWISLTVFSYWFLALAFMPQNYQLGASGPTYVGVIFLSLLFMFREFHSSATTTNRVVP